MYVTGYVTEETLTSTKYDHDPRVRLLRKPCKRCGAARGEWCQTPTGFRTLHKTRGGAP